MASGEGLGEFMTRDMVQGFLDGHKMAGHPLSCSKDCLDKYLGGHKIYPQSNEDRLKILSDIDSYKK